MATGDFYENLARQIISDLERFSDVDLPSSRILRLAFAYAKIAQWSILKGKTEGAERCIAASLKCLKISREETKRELETVEA